MKLTKFAFRTSDWILDEINLSEINLIVGRNASGKSRALASLDTLILLLKNGIGYTLYDFSATLVIEGGNEKIEYQIEFEKTVVKTEKLYFNGELYLDRNSKVTRLRPIDLEFELINPPHQNPTMHVRRDIKAYPYFEQLASWAENSHEILFGNITNFSRVKELYRVNQPSFEQRNIIDLFERLKINQREWVINQLSNMGFNIMSIKHQSQNKIFKTLSLTEEGVGIIDSTRLSQGMYRTLYILIFIEYISQERNPQTIIIDDLCEGLDYNRSIKLGELLISFCKEKDIQLIVSSNDGFLMDIIDLEHWTVLQREGKHVSCINYRNSQRLFDDFKFTGLSNFDFFSSDYIINAKKQDE